MYERQIFSQKGGLHMLRTYLRKPVELNLYGYWSLDMGKKTDYYD